MFDRRDASDWGRLLQQGEPEGGRHLAEYRWNQGNRMRRNDPGEPSDAEKVVVIYVIVAALYAQTL